MNPTGQLARLVGYPFWLKLPHCGLLALTLAAQSLPARAEPALQWEWDGLTLAVSAEPLPSKVDLMEGAQKLESVLFQPDDLLDGWSKARIKARSPGRTLRATLVDPSGKRMGVLFLPPQDVGTGDHRAASASGRNQLEARWQGGVALLRDVGRASLWTQLGARGAQVLEHLRTLPPRLSRAMATVRQPPVKDEFETTSAYTARVEAYNASVRRVNDACDRWLSKAPTRLTAGQWARVATQVLAEHAPAPTIVGIRYDADTQNAFLTLGPESFLKDMNLPTLVTAAIPPEQARRIKASVSSLAPAWTFRVDDSGALGLARIEVQESGQTLALVPADPAALARITPLPDIRVETLSAATSSGALKTVDLPTTITQDPELWKLAQELADLQRRQAETGRTDSERRRLEKEVEEARKKLAGMQREGAGIDDLPGRLAKAPAAPTDSHRHMLAIGISDYRNIPVVPFASDAAQAVKLAGTRLLGIPEANATLLTDDKATQGAFKGWLKRMQTRIGPQDTLYFYYAGHGAPSRDGKSAYLMPQDADEASFEEEDLRLEGILAQLAASKARRIVVMLDACFSGRSGPQAMLFKGVAPVMVTPTSTLPDPDRITLFTASEGNQFANEYRAHGQRLFTWHLVDALLAGVRDIKPLADRVREGVGLVSRGLGPTYEQTPMVQGKVAGGL